MYRNHNSLVIANSEFIQILTFEQSQSSASPQQRSRVARWPLAPRLGALAPPCLQGGWQPQRLEPGAQWERPGSGELPYPDCRWRSLLQSRASSSTMGACSGTHTPRGGLSASRRGACSTSSPWA